MVESKLSFVDIWRLTRMKTDQITHMCTWLAAGCIQHYRAEFGVAPWLCIHMDIVPKAIRPPIRYNNTRTAGKNLHCTLNLRPICDEKSHIFSYDNVFSNELISSLAIGW